MPTRGKDLENLGPESGVQGLQPLLALYPSSGMKVVLDFGIPGAPCVIGELFCRP